MRTFEALIEVGKLRQYLDACKSHEAVTERSFAGLIEEEDTSLRKRRKRAARKRQTIIRINLCPQLRAG